MKIQHFILALSLFIFSALPAFAAPADDTAYIALVEQAQQAPASGDYAKLRAIYPSTSYYTPFGSMRYGEKLQAAEKKYVADKDPAAKAEMEKIFKENFAHFHVHMMALQFKQNDNIDFIDPALHSAALKEIVKSIMAGGDGKTVQTAYNVIDVSEEYLVMQAFYGYKVKGQAVVTDNGHSYDVMDFEDPKGATGKMYFNVDIPMSHYEDEAKKVEIAPAPAAPAPTP